jgi:hypothetical protein
MFYRQHYIHCESEDDSYLVFSSRGRILSPADSETSAKEYIDKRITEFEEDL